MPGSQAEGLLERLQEQAADLRRKGYEADASRQRNVAEQATYVTLVVRVPDEQTREEV